MNKLKSEINKAAHYLAHVNEIRIKHMLDTKCQELLAQGKSTADVAKYLQQLVADGVNGSVPLLG